MKPQTSTAPDFFLNLGVIATLYTVVISFLSLAFDVINKLFPDTVPYYGEIYSAGVRLALATLIIVFPVFVWLSRIVIRTIHADEARKNAAVRRWMVYVTLFLSSATIITDLVILLNTYLNGEISVRFTLKVVSVLVVGGIVFWHYLTEIRGTASKRQYTVTLYGSSILVLVLVVYAFIVFGSPTTVRKLRADDIRIGHLQTIQYQVLSRWQQKRALPEALVELNDDFSNFVTPIDPETKEAYVYAKTGKLTFALCARFDLATPTDGGTVRSGIVDGGYPYGALGENGNVWKHAAGKECFERTIDPELYPVTKGL